jgi:flagella basal body P-ring formation protein FlgA
VPEPLPKPVLRAGDRATAVFLSNRLRMAASVTCLERGREGEVIRVRSQDGRVFRARISGPARLEVLPQ